MKGKSTIVNQKPILFSAHNVRAFLEGRKNQTRRLAMMRACGMIKPLEIGQEDDINLTTEEVLALAGEYCGTIVKPYATAGERRYVQETWRVHKDYDRLKPSLIHQAMNGDTAHCVDYRATPREGDFWGKWRPGIFMSPWASRIKPTVVNARLERLQMITPADAIAEGVTYPVAPVEGAPGKGHVLWNISADISPLDYCPKEDRGNHDKIIVAHFAAGWDTIHGKGAWAKNQWVWRLVLEYDVDALTGTADDFHPIVSGL